MTAGRTAAEGERMGVVEGKPSPRAPKEAESHFQDLEQQADAVHLGMWIFLAGELLLFSGLFTLYAAYRGRFPSEFAEGARHTTLWMGTTGTFLLLLASFLVAGSIHAVREDRRKRSGWMLLGAALLGAAFLGVKFWEYAKHAGEGLLPGRWFEHPELAGLGHQVFFTLYYVITGAHALHVIGGIGVLLFLAWRVRRGSYDSVYHTPQEAGGMYWHLVDVVWLFVWPFFYLMR